MKPVVYEISNPEKEILSKGWVVVVWRIYREILFIEAVLKGWF